MLLNQEPQWAWYHEVLHRQRKAILDAIPPQDNCQDLFSRVTGPWTVLTMACLEQQTLFGWMGKPKASPNTKSSWVKAGSKALWVKGAASRLTLRTKTPSLTALHLKNVFPRLRGV